MWNRGQIVGVNLYTQAINAQTRTNAKFCWFRSLGTSNIADYTTVAPFIGLMHTGDS